MTKRIHFDIDGDGKYFADISNALHEEAVNRAMSEGLTVQEALHEVLTEEIESVE